MEERPLIFVQHPVTRRWAILEDDGTSAWFFVTTPDEQQPVGDCFVYCSQPPAPALPPDRDRGCPPPVITEYATDRAYRPGLTEDDLVVAWSPSGAAAAVWILDEPVALLVVGEKFGYSKGLAKDGPYGHLWNEALFIDAFPLAAWE